jgi:hypothetical protein
MAGLSGLLVLAVAAAGSLPSRGSAEQDTGAPQQQGGEPQAAEQGPAAEQGAAAKHGEPSATRHAPHHGRRSGLEERVALLTKELDLDAKQQAGVRRALLRQRDQVQRIWRDGAVPSADRIFATRAVSNQTAQQIRALLNEEQRKRYDPPAEADVGHAIGKANVESWMKGGGLVVH